MSDLSAAAFLSLVTGRHGHFRMESGHHGSLWLDLDPLFARPGTVAPYVERLAEALRPYDVGAVCGPLVGGAFLAQLVAPRLGAEFWFTSPAPGGGSGQGGLYGARYTLPAVLAARARDRRVAVVDDVVSAGSSVRATCAALEASGAVVVVAGALLVLGAVGEAHLARRGVPVVAVTRSDYAMWPPDACPRCASRVPLEDVPSAAPGS